MELVEKIDKLEAGYELDRLVAITLMGYVEEHRDTTWFSYSFKRPYRDTWQWSKYPEEYSTRLQVAQKVADIMVHNGWFCQVEWNYGPDYDWWEAMFANWWLDDMEDGDVEDIVEIKATADDPALAICRAALKAYVVHQEKLREGKGCKFEPAHMPVPTSVKRPKRKDNRMGRPRKYDDDFRLQLRAEYDAGRTTQRELAVKYNIPSSTVGSLLSTTRQLPH